MSLYAKQTTGLQEQLPMSLKYGGDTRPWVAMFKRAEAVEASYDTLVTLMTRRGKLDLIANVSRAFNKEIMYITK